MPPTGQESAQSFETALSAALEGRRRGAGRRRLRAARAARAAGASGSPSGVGRRMRRSSADLAEPSTSEPRIHFVWDRDRLCPHSGRCVARVKIAVQNHCLLAPAHAVGPLLADLYSLWEWRLLFALVGLVQRSYDDFARQLETRADESPRISIARVLVSRPIPPTPGPTLQPAPASVRALLLEAAAEMLKLGTSVLRWVPGTCRLPETSPPESLESGEAQSEMPATIPEDAPSSGRKGEEPQAPGSAPASDPAPVPQAAPPAGMRTRALGMMRAAALASKPASPRQRQGGKARNPSSGRGAEVGSLVAPAPAAPKLAPVTGTRSSSRLTVGLNAQSRASQRRLLSSVSQPRSSAAPGRKTIHLGKKSRPGGAADVPSSQASLATLGGELAFAPTIVALAEALAEGAGAAAEDAAKWVGAWPVIPEMLFLAGSQPTPSVQAGQGSMTRASSLAASLQCVFAYVAMESCAERGEFSRQMWTAERLLDPVAPILLECCAQDGASRGRRTKHPCHQRTVHGLHAPCPGHGGEVSANCRLFGASPRG